MSTGPICRGNWKMGLWQYNIIKSWMNDELMSHSWKSRSWSNNIFFGACSCFVCTVLTVWEHHSAILLPAINIRYVSGHLPVTITNNKIHTILQFYKIEEWWSWKRYTSILCKTNYSHAKKETAFYSPSWYLASDDIRFSLWKSLHLDLKTHPAWTWWRGMVKMCSVQGRQSR